MLDESSAGPGAPFGKGVAEALEYLLDLARKDGFQTKNLDGYAGHVEYGEGEELIGVLGHVDVVPPGDGWTTPPFAPEIRDGKLYARGAIDDKGPTMAAYFALRLIKELGLPLSKRVRLILGTDEENLWRDMAYYFEREEMPSMGFAPDADFPIIYAEKGLLDITLVGDGSAAAGEADAEAWTLARWEAGHRFNMVPDGARAVLEGSGDVFDLKMKYQDYLLQNRIRGYAQEADDHLLLVLEGRSHHGSEPDKGLNAGLELARFLHSIALDPEGARFIGMIHDLLVDDFFGNKLGIAQEDDTVGPLTVNAGVFRYEKGGERRLGLNVRYPIRGDSESILKRHRGAGAPLRLRDRGDGPQAVPLHRAGSSAGPHPVPGIRGADGRQGLAVGHRRRYLCPGPRERRRLRPPVSGQGRDRPPGGRVHRGGGSPQGGGHLRPGDLRVGEIKIKDEKGIGGSVSLRRQKGRGTLFFCFGRFAPGDAPPPD